MFKRTLETAPPNFLEPGGGAPAVETVTANEDPALVSEIIVG